jgi:glutathione S-transferase
MKLFFSPASPYVRKCTVIAHELNLSARIENLAAAANPINRDASIVAKNPLGKIPALITDGGKALYDSRVICEYLNDVGKGSFFPASGDARWLAQTEQALGDGILDAALLARYESAMRPEALRWPEWVRGQMEKIESGIGYIDTNCGAWGARFDIGTVTLACALGYLDFRFASYDWRAKFPTAAQWFAQVSERESMKLTVPKV